jgi:hypothetical protein
MLTLEAGDDIRPHQCDHCQEIYRSTFGFIYRDGDAYAVYHAALYARHPDRRVSLAITVADDWSEDAVSADRISVALRVRRADGGLAMTVVDRNESPWADTSTHAGLLDRAEALENPQIGTSSTWQTTLSGRTQPLEPTSPLPEPNPSRPDPAPRQTAGTPNGHSNASNLERAPTASFLRVHRVMAGGARHQHRLDSG